MSNPHLEISQQLQQLLSQVEDRTKYFLGYPVSKDFDYSELLPFLQFPMNNLGDPFVKSTYQVDSREMEREVVHFFAELFRANPENVWGYVTNGGSEGNLYGLYVARELYPNAMVYFSEDTHYSIQKNVTLLNMEYVIVRSQENGEIDYNDLKEAIRYNRHRPVVVVANIGTTMTEAKDHIPTIKKIVTDMAIEKHYVHADAALAGGFAPFIEPRPAFDFVDGCDSISVSGHKFIGSPMPSGVVVVKKENRDRIAKKIAYIGSSDATITGSRNGHSPLFLWYAIKKLGLEGFALRTQHSLQVAAYTEKRLNEIGVKAWRNPNAITVVFSSPSIEVRAKWQLATEKGQSHIICMPNVTFEQIDEFISDVLSLND
ncbi:histidine decarboxylase [Flavobacterium covae]|uniref:Histidine decarboxylase n=1 Tax=Flavobacterium covae TaxID=2906076 RepID=A0ABW8PD35_9FLAO|nr:MULTISPECIES: histidine decarboxylase [Flavobacterium]OWP80276.1 histidine decarboxylase [Flavobacterium covae]POR20836.1 histidine decarboxylase [Flavobacterium columnare]